MKMHVIWFYTRPSAAYNWCTPLLISKLYCKKTNLKDYFSWCVYLRILFKGGSSNAGSSDLSWRMGLNPPISVHLLRATVIAVTYGLPLGHLIQHLYKAKTQWSLYFSFIFACTASSLWWWRCRVRYLIFHQLWLTSMSLRLKSWSLTSRFIYH